MQALCEAGCGYPLVAINTNLEWTALAEVKCSTDENGSLKLGEPEQLMCLSVEWT